GRERLAGVAGRKVKSPAARKRARETPSSAMVPDKLRAVLGPEKVATDEPSRAARRRDAWVPSQLADVEKAKEPLPACVVRPTELADVVAVVDICREARAPLVPFGLGSGVGGGVLAPEASAVLAMGAMHR